MNEPFDAVAWMRRRRTDIDEEDERLSWEQKRERTVAVLRGDPLWERVKHLASSGGEASRTPDEAVTEPGDRTTGP